MMTTYAAARVRTRRVREETGGPRNGERRRTVPPVRFPLGRLYATPSALSLLAEIRDAGNANSVQRAGEPGDPASLVLPYLRRHASGDWGDVNREDWVANDEALRTGGRLFSAYELPAGARLWIITEADRCGTTVLLPEEY